VFVAGATGVIGRRLIPRLVKGGHEVAGMTRSPDKAAHGERHLRRVLAEYSRHYNEHRPHQSREQRPPLHEPGQPIDMTARIKRTHVVHGLISEYRRTA